MTFSEAMDELLSGRKVRQCYWEDDTYIMLDSRGDIVDASSWKVFISNVYRDKLDDVIKSYRMKVIKDSAAD